MDGMEDRITNLVKPELDINTTWVGKNLGAISELVNQTKIHRFQLGANKIGN